MKFLVFLYLISLLNFHYVYAGPVPAPLDSKTSPISGSDIWSLIERRDGAPDFVVPSLCPSPCQKLFKAQNVNFSGAECACQCSAKMPVFLQSTGQCVGRLEECRNNLQFSSSEKTNDSAYIPLIRLPTPGNIIAPEKRILWKESGIKQRPETGARCNITGVFYLKNDRNWQETSPRLLYLGWAENDTKLFWNGTVSQAQYFEGTVLQLKLDCSSNEKNAHCIVFRVMGQISSLSSELSPINMFSHAQSRLETVLIILLAILLFLSIFGSIILWNVCWRLKKTELISTLQMQFLYHVKQEKEKAAVEAAHRYQQIARAAAAHHHASNNGMVGGDDSMTDAMDGSQPMAIKRKLYFSAEFFEPHFMTNPPPMAEQFIHDLRRMIEIAKQKIQLRRHVPQLVPILEEKEEHYQQYMELQSRNLSSPTNICTQTPTTSDTPNEENSPKSTKSSDSGRDSMKDSYSSSEGSDPSASPKEVKKMGTIKEEVGDKKNGEMQVKEMLSEEEPDPKKPPITSRIPVITNGFSKSPRLAAKSSNLTTPKNGLTNGYLEAPPLPPRNPSMQEELYSPPSLSQSDPPPSTPTRPSGGIARRKAYAVFPSSHDSMLKKSLPRRSKKKTLDANTGGVIETNM